MFYVESYLGLVVEIYTAYLGYLILILGMNDSATVSVN
jgi:hypothetical protein